MKLVHSFHYFENSVKLEHGRIIDLKTGSTIQILVNMCKDKEIFSPVIEKVLSKKKSLQNYKRFFNNKKVNCNICYNTKVTINININNLVKAIKNNRFFDRSVFFLLVKRSCNNLNTINSDTFLDDIKNKNNEFKMGIEFNYFGNQIVKFNNLYLDLENQLIYFNVEDIRRNIFNFSLKNTQIMFTHSNRIINEILERNSVFENSKQNLVIYDSQITNIKEIINKLNLNKNNYIELNDDNITNVRYRDIVNKTILINYQCLSFKYKANILHNTTDFKDSQYALELLIERFRYETKFMNREKFLDLSRVILHTLVYDNVIVFDFDLNENRQLNNIFVKSFLHKQAYFISKNFLDYNVDSIFYKLQLFFNINLEGEISFDMVTKFLNSVFIDDYSNLKKEKSILFEYSKQELDVIENSQNVKNEKSSLPILFPIEKMEAKDMKYINNNTCSICLEKLKSGTTVKTSCNHYFCHSCLVIHLNSKNNIACPLCRNELNIKTGFTQLVNKPKTLPGKLGKIFQSITNNSLIISNYNENLYILSKILQNYNSDYKEVTLINKKIINKSDEFIGNKTLIFLENNVDKYTKYLYRNSEIKVLVPIKELTL